MSDARGFALCDGCGRHVRGGESVCPFCQATITAAPRPIHTRPGALPARATLLAGAALAGAALATLATAMAGCDSPPPAPPQEQPHPTPALPPYGVAPHDDGSPFPVQADASAAQASPGAPDAAAGHHMMAPMYGAPPHRRQP